MNTPVEFRIFRAGANATTKGTFLFDAKAAAAVMAAYKAQGVDQMIDLEHEALGDLGRPDSHDARGWYALEVRNGELWAVNVRWTPDGRRRLSEKTQRYISPAFLTDDEGRVIEMINCALVAMPATHEAMPLAASRRKVSRGGKLVHHHALTRAVAGAAQPKMAVVPVKLTHAQRRGLDVACKFYDLTRSAALRLAFNRFAAGRDPRFALDELVASLKLPAEASADEIIAAIKTLLEESTISPGTKAELRRRGISTREFLQRRANVERSMRRVK
jgi:hypothetical protein